MFERYTERARRVIFFARYEASQLGSPSIESEHLLLGLIREGKGLTSRLFGKSQLSTEEIRKDIELRAFTFRERCCRVNRIKHLTTVFHAPQESKRQAVRTLR